MRHMTTHKLALLTTLLTVALLGTPSCAPVAGPPAPTVHETPTAEPRPEPGQSYVLPHAGSWTMPGDRPIARTPWLQGTVIIEGLGEFAFSPVEIRTTRPDIFTEGHFSVFDVVAHLGDKGWFPLRYHYNPALDTHVIDELNGQMNWWYRMQSPGGWQEINTFRMDMAPYTDGMSIRLLPQPDEYMGRIHSSFAEELLRKSVNLGRVIIPEVRIGTVVHTNVPVSAHDSRTDVLKPGTVTALDVLFSLADQKKIDRLMLTWYADTQQGTPLDSFWVEQIDDGDGVHDLPATPTTGTWVYETGAREFSGFKGSHINIPADVRVLVSPEYMTWYWLGSPA